MASNFIKPVNSRIITLYDVLEHRWDSFLELNILNLEDLVTDTYKYAEENRSVSNKIITISNLTRKMLLHFNVLPHDVRCAFVIGKASEPNIVYVRHYRDKADSKRQLTIGWFKDSIVIKSSTGFNVEVKNVTEFTETILHAEEYKEQIKNVTKSLQPVALTDFRNKNQYADLFSVLMDFNNKLI